MARFPEGTLEKIDSVLNADEDRPGFVRKAVDLEIALRQEEFYKKLAQSLVFGETEIAFCVKAISIALEHRRAALAEAEYMGYRPRETERPPTADEK